jgi:hypothetical protein
MGNPQDDPGVDCPGMLEFIESMTRLTIGILKQASEIHGDGESEYIARTEVLDLTDSHFAGFSPPIRAALESHVRQVVAEFFEIRREPWEV